MKYIVYILGLVIIFYNTQAQGVGIGTDYPQATLHINGTLRIDSLFNNEQTLLVLVRDSVGNIFYRNLEQLISFRCGDTLIDARDGQTYKTTLIGNQCWTAENLNYFIPNKSFYYANDSLAYAETYGRMYKWGALSEVCPLGWHVPTHYEWQVLQNVGIAGSANGGFLKQQGATLWNTPNVGATNYTGFNAVPGGNYNSVPPAFTSMGEHVEYWSSTEWSSAAVYSWQLHYSHSNLVYLFNPKSHGLYCRCVMD